MSDHARELLPRSLIGLGVAAVAELLARPATNLDELAARLAVRTEDLALALRLPSLAPLVVWDGAALHAAPGATSATLPDARRRALASRRRRR